jgi:hypothetical protein
MESSEPRSSGRLANPIDPATEAPSHAHLDPGLTVFQAAIAVRVDNAAEVGHLQLLHLLANSLARVVRRVGDRRPNLNLMGTTDAVEHVEGVYGLKLRRTGQRTPDPLNWTGASYRFNCRQRPNPRA